jgi:hypothetical protein
MYTFFLVPYLYNRVTIWLESRSFTAYPNFLTSFRPASYEVLDIRSVQFQNSNVSIYNTLNTLSISLQLSPRVTKVEVHYETFITHLSLWGALWGILFSLFALAFLGYNRNKFRKEHPDWDQFDKKVDLLENNIARADQHTTKH